MGNCLTSTPRASAGSGILVDRSGQPRESTVGRKDFYYDADAPTAQTIVAAASVFTLNAQRQLLLIRRTDNGLWALPGGAQEIGERIADAAARETLEETGIS